MENENDKEELRKYTITFSSKYYLYTYLFKMPFVINKIICEKGILDQTIIS